MSKSNFEFNIQGLARLFWRGRLWIALFVCTGVLGGLFFSRWERPVYRVEYVLTRSPNGNFGDLQRPFLRMLPLTVAPIYYTMQKSEFGKHEEEGAPVNPLVSIVPTADGIFEQFMRYARGLNGLEATFHDPNIIALGRQKGLDDAQMKRLQSELLRRIRFENLGVSFERTRFVLVGHDPELLEAIALSYFQKTADLVASELRQNFETRAGQLKSLIDYRIEYLKELSGGDVGLRDYRLLVTAEQKLLEGDLRRLETGLKFQFKPNVYQISDDVNVVLMRPKPKLYLVLGVAVGLLLGCWAVIMLEIVRAPFVQSNRHALA